MKANVKQTNWINNNNDSESFISEQPKDADMEAKTNKEEQEKKRKK